MRIDPLISAVIHLASFPNVVSLCIIIFTLVTSFLPISQRRRLKTVSLVGLVNFALRRDEPPSRFKKAGARRRTTVVRRPAPRADEPR